MAVVAVVALSIRFLKAPRHLPLGCLLDDEKVGLPQRNPAMDELSSQRVDA